MIVSRRGTAFFGASSQGEKSDDNVLAKSTKRYLTLLAFIFAAPVFFVVQGGIRLSPPLSAEIIAVPVFPLSAFGLIPLFFIALFFVRNFRLAPLFFVYSYILVMFFSLLFGIFSGAVEHNLGRSVGRFLQTLFPVTGFFVGYIAFVRVLDPYTRAIQVGYFIKAFCFITLVVLCLYIIQTLLTGPTSRFSLLADHIGPFYNPKVKRFLPTLLAFASLYFFVLSFVQEGLRKKKILYFIAASALFLGITFYWSRTALVAFFFGLLVFAFASNSAARKLIGLFLLAYFSLIAFIVLREVEFNQSGSFARVLNTLLQLTGAGGYENYGDFVRLNRIGFAFEVTFSRPFGSSFQLYEQYLFPVRDIPIAENGFLDVGVRGGLLAIFSVTALIVLSLKRLREWSIVTDLAAAYAPLAALMLASMFFLHILTDTYLAQLVWFLLGSVMALDRRRPALKPGQRRRLSRRVYPP